MPTLEKVHYSELLPHEFRVRLADRALGWLPLGTLEWHGEQNPLGADSILSQGLFERAARRFGGIVFPPLFLGPDRIKPLDDGRTLVGMDYADVTTPHRQLDGSCYRIGEGLFLSMLEAVFQQARRAGFKAMVADGHGPSRWALGRHAEHFENEFDLKIVSVQRDLATKGWLSQMDHAARNETSLMMALRPELVDLGRLSQDRKVWPQGVGGQDPRDASAAYGEECLATSLKLLEEELKRRGILPG
ncbi:MAG TPA: creatininase family protein [Planctomycetota bacterium]|nr:creatininase family protein [Planctomycetota bacterium]